MAKHFKQDVGKTKVARRSAAATRQRRQAVPTTARQANYAGPTWNEDYYSDDAQGDARGGIRRLGRGFFLVIAWVARLAAICLFALVMLNSFNNPLVEYYGEMITDFITGYLPWHAWGVLAVDTPFGGLFRCDLCIASILLFVVDWVACRIRAALV